MSNLINNKESILKTNKTLKAQIKENKDILNSIPEKQLRKRALIYFKLANLEKSNGNIPSSYRYALLGKESLDEADQLDKENSESFLI